MTLNEIKVYKKDYLIPKDVAEVLEADPYSINIQAQEDAAKLGFPVIVIGTRVRIPRLPFIEFMEELGDSKLTYKIFKEINLIKEKLEVM